MNCMVQPYYVPMLLLYDVYIYISCREGPAVALKSWGPLWETDEGSTGVDQSA